MKTTSLLTFACRHCRYYQPEGRRGGVCQLLGVSVQSNWKSCAMAIPVFGSAWEGLEGIEEIMMSGTSPVVTSPQIELSELKAV